MDDWMKRLIDVLIGFDQPIELADLRRLLGPHPDAPVGDPDDKFLFDAINKIRSQTTDAGLTLVVEDGYCVSCGRTNYFSPSFSYTCEYCNKKTVTPPKFCLNRRDSMY
ncbi:MAG: hypothetical protein ACFFF4_06150 [Candidatus Thorarchaeota archaeon]